MDDDNNLNETATFLDREPPTVLSGGTTTGVVVPATAEATAPPPQPDEGLEKAEWQQDGVSESILEKAEARFKQGMSELKTESAKDAATPGRVGSRLVTKTAALADALGLEFGWKVVLQVLRRMQVVRDAAPHVPTDAGPTYLCPECTGSGLIDGTAENGGKRLACPPCNGNGLVQFVGGWPSAHPCVVVFVCSEADARLVARRVTRYPRIVRINLDGVHGGRGNHPARKSDFVQCPECAGQGRETTSIWPVSAARDRASSTCRGRGPRLQAALLSASATWTTRRTLQGSSRMSRASSTSDSDSRLARRRRRESGVAIKVLSRFVGRDEDDRRACLRRPDGRAVAGRTAGAKREVEADHRLASTSVAGADGPHGWKAPVFGATERPDRPREGGRR
jgi:hypothetical protein